MLNSITDIIPSYLLTCILIFFLHNIISSSFISTLLFIVFFYQLYTCFYDIHILENYNLIFSLNGLFIVYSCIIIPATLLYNIFTQPWLGRIIAYDNNSFSENEDDWLLSRIIILIFVLCSSAYICFISFHHIYNHFFYII